MTSVANFFPAIIAVFCNACCGITPGHLYLPFEIIYVIPVAAVFPRVDYFINQSKAKGKEKTS